MEKNEAMYYKKGDNNEVYCLLCPHYCKIMDGKVGKCRVRRNQDGLLYTMNYGKISSYAYDPIEKKPLYHFYPGTSIFSIGSFGCNLGCDFCQNWEIVYEETLVTEISDEDMLQLIKAKDSIGVAYTYNEPTIWYEYILELSKKVKEKELKNIIITNGYINEEPLKELLPYIDAMNIDLKSIEDSFYKALCNGSLEPVLRTIQIAAELTHVEISTLVIDGENSSMDEIKRLAETLAGINKSIPLHLNRYFPAYKMKVPATNMDRLIKGRDIAKEYLDYVYIGNAWGLDNNSYCPNCYHQLVSRHREGEVIGIENGNCKKCKNKVNFIY